LYSLSNAPNGVLPNTYDVDEVFDDPNEYPFPFMKVLFVPVRSTSTISEYNVSIYSENTAGNTEALSLIHNATSAPVIDDLPSSSELAFISLSNIKDALKKVKNNLLKQQETSGVIFGQSGPADKGGAQDIGIGQTGHSEHTFFIPLELDSDDDQ